MSLVKRVGGKKEERPPSRSTFSESVTHEKSENDYLRTQFLEGSNKLSVAALKALAKQSKDSDIDIVELKLSAFNFGFFSQWENNTIPYLVFFPFGQAVSKQRLVAISFK